MKIILIKIGNKSDNLELLEKELIEQGLIEKGVLKEKLLKASVSCLSRNPLLLFSNHYSEDQSEVAIILYENYREAVAKSTYMTFHKAKELLGESKSLILEKNIRSIFNTCKNGIVNLTEQPDELIKNLLPELGIFILPTTINARKLLKTCISGNSEKINALLKELNPQFLEEKLKKHFDCTYSTFKEAMEKEYPNLDKRQRFLFSLLKEGNNAEFIKKVKWSDIDAKDKNNRTLFSWARDLNNQNVLDHLFLLAQVFLLAQETESEDKNYLLNWSLYCRQPLETIKHLANDKTVNACTLSLEPPLLIAVRDKRIDVIQHLLSIPKTKINKASTTFDAKAYYNSAGQRQTLRKVFVFASPLFMAAQYGYIEIVELLLKTPGIKVNLYSGNSTALDIAAQMNHRAIVELLISHGAFVSSKVKEQLREGLTEDKSKPAKANPDKRAAELLTNKHNFFNIPATLQTENIENKISTSILK